MSERTNSNRYTSIQSSVGTLRQAVSQLKTHRRESELLEWRHAKLTNLRPPESPPPDKLADMIADAQEHVNKWLALNEIGVLMNDADIVAQLDRLHTELDDYQPQDEDVLERARSDDCKDAQTMLLGFIRSQSVDHLRAAVIATGEPGKFKRTIRDTLKSNSLQLEDRALLDRSRTFLQECRISVCSVSEMEARVDLPYLQIHRPGGHGHNLTESGQFQRSSPPSANHQENGVPSSQNQATNNVRQGSLGNNVDAQPYVASPVTYDIPKIIYDEGVKLANVEGLYSYLFANPGDNNFRKTLMACHKAIAETSTLLEFFNSQFIRNSGNQTHETILECLDDLLSVQSFENEPDCVILNRETYVLVDKIEQQSSGLSKTINSIRNKLTGHTPPTPSVASSHHSSSTSSQVSKADRVARQLVNQEITLFHQITLPDCIEWLCRPDIQERNTLGQFLRNHHAITDWCQCDVLFETEHDDEEARARAITFWCEVIDICVELRAYSTANALLAGLDSPFVQQGVLGDCWRLVEPRTKKSFRKNKELLSRNNKCESYWAHIEGHKDGSFLPIVGLHLRKVQKEYQTSASKSVVEGEKLLNFKALTQACREVERLLEFKRTIAWRPSDETILTHVQNMLLKVQLLEGLQTKFAQKSARISEGQGDRRSQRGLDGA
ncbi:ras GEF, partial [Ceratobasidium sp. AG-I]